MKKVLILYFSQTGQTKKMVEAFGKGLKEAQVKYLQVEPVDKYEFPWKIKNFFRQFPKAICGVVPKVRYSDPSLLEDKYDLVVFAYQVWFLSPSLPMQAVLADKDLSSLLAGQNILNLVTSRNMWVSAVQRFNQSLLQAGARGVRNLVLCDLSPAWATFVTTPRWLLTGRKNAFWFFPEAGIAEVEYDRAQQVAKKWEESSNDENFTTIKLSHRQGFATVAMERVGYAYFRFMARLIQAVCPQENGFKDLLLLIFRLGLVMLILLLLPLTAVYSLFFKRIMGQKFANKINSVLEV